MADRIIPEQSFYAGRTTAANVMSALEMAIEIADDKSRDYALAATIEGGLRDNDTAINEFHLSAVLSERISDRGQSNRVIECLRTLAAQLGVKDAETALTN